MKIARMKTNRLTNPLGFDLSSLTLSWTVEDTPSKTCKEARVLVATDSSFENIVNDSGFRADISGIAYHVELELQPRTRYHWRVTVRGDRGDDASGEAWFETAKMDEPWSSKWITPSLDKSVQPYIRKGFELPSAVRSARLYATGLGIYELELNGAKVGDECLTPGFHAYDRWVQYQTYDVTTLLARGKNAIGAMLGDGWAKGRFGFEGLPDGWYCEKLYFICELRATLDDGSEFVLSSDDTWKCAPSGVMSSSIYDGEHIDARKMIPGWSGMRFDDTAWTCVTESTPSLGELSARLSPPIKSMLTVRPIEVIKTPIGETVLDMGQNMVGWLTFENRLAAGTELRLTFGEILQNDCFYTGNLRSAKQQFVYISDGTPTSVRPRFTFYGFRFVKVEGWQGDVTCDDFTAHVLYSECDATGSIETSNDEVNRLFLNALWGQRGNFVDVPTDCPQRDERMGWTGDAQVFSGTALYNMDSSAFYLKFMRDMLEEQSKYDGNVPCVVPNVIHNLNGGFPGGAVAWGDCATVIPWNVYVHSGDTALLAQCYANMTMWVDWITKVDGGCGGLKWAQAFHFADWLALDNYREPTSCIGGTPNSILCAAYYYLSASLTAKAARVLGKAGDAEKYEKLSGDIADTVRREFFTPSGRLAVHTQTAHVIVLFLGLSPDKNRTAADLVELLTDPKSARDSKPEYALSTGFIGTPWLCRALSAAGYDDIAYSLFLKRDYPSWLYEVSMGATTIWERWNSVLPDGSISDTGMNSLNHYAYGSIAEWMYRDMCGLNPDEASPGFKHAHIAPRPDTRIGYAKCDVMTAAGRYKSGWQFLDDGSLRVDVTVPFDSSATLLLPRAKLSSVTGPSSLKARQKGERVEFALPAGEYSFTYKPLPLND